MCGNVHKADAVTTVYAGGFMIKVAIGCKLFRDLRVNLKGNRR